MKPHSYVETRYILKFEDAEDGTEKAFVRQNKEAQPEGENNPLKATAWGDKLRAEMYASYFTAYPLKIKPKAIKLQITVTWEE